MLNHIFLSSAPTQKDIVFLLLTYSTMASSLSVQHLYEYSVLSSFEVTSKESFLSTVNNGKALSMTFLYAYMALRFASLSSTSLSPLRFSARHKQRYHKKKSNTVIVAVSSIIHTVNNGKAWSMTELYAYTGANIYSTDTQLALRCGCSISARTTHNDTTDIGRATR